MPSQKLTMITERIEQILRDVRVPDSQVTIAVTKIQKLYRDILVPVVLSQRMYKISREVFEIEFKKAFQIVKNPQGKSQVTDTDISSDRAKSRKKEGKTYYDRKEIMEETYCESKPTRARERAQGNKPQTVESKVTNYHDIRKAYQKGYQEKNDRDRPCKGRNPQSKYKFDRALKPTADEGNEARSVKEVSNDREREETYLKKSQNNKSNCRRPCKGQQQFKTDEAYKPATETKLTTLLWKQ